MRNNARAPSILGNPHHFQPLTVDVPTDPRGSQRLLPGWRDSVAPGFPWLDLVEPRSGQVGSVAMAQESQSASAEEQEERPGLAVPGQVRARDSPRIATKPMTGQAE